VVEVVVRVAVADMEDILRQLGLPEPFADPDLVLEGDPLAVTLGGPADSDDDLENDWTDDDDDDDGGGATLPHGGALG